VSLRNQPYIPLYVDDFLSDEKLNECSAKSIGVYIKIMCLMHKSDEYGKILLKQKDLIGANIIENFALKLNKHFPFTKTIIEESLRELIDEKVLYIESDKLCQKRMIRDNSLSILRSEVGRKGGKKTQFASKFGKAKIKASRESKDKAKEQANTVIGIVNEIEYKDERIKGAWLKFREYKRSELKFSYKSLTSEQIAVNELINLCNGDFDLADKIVNQSISNGWKGLFELKNDVKLKTDKKLELSPDQNKELLEYQQKLSGKHGTI
jgi:hypothetical protein